MVIYGTRPEAIKVAPVIEALKEDPTLSPYVVVTGQHREMLDQVNKVFDIVPDADMNLFAHGQTLNKLTSRIFSSLDPILDEQEPDAVLVQGDTTTVMAAAIASFYRNIKVIHLEAGLRSHDLMSPFPEEANRKVVSQISSLHLAPTESSKANLVREGVDESKIVVTGNTVIDALLHTVDQNYDFSEKHIAKATSDDRRIVLVTTHRRENWGEAMQNVGRALRRIAESFPNIHVILPAHRNPVVREAILPHLKDIGNVTTSEPLEYQEFANLIGRSHLIITDSGGIQEEAPTLGIPVLVIRDNTERPEAVDAGTVKLVGSDEDRIYEEASRLLTDSRAYDRMSGASNPYGDGHSAKRCISAINRLLETSTISPAQAHADFAHSR